MEVQTILDRHLENGTFQWYVLRSFDLYQIEIHGQIKNLSQLMKDLSTFDVELFIVENYGDFYDLTDALHVIRSQHMNHAILSMRKCTISRSIRG